MSQSQPWINNNSLSQNSKEGKVLLMTWASWHCLCDSFYTWFIIAKNDHDDTTTNTTNNKLSKFSMNIWILFCVWFLISFKICIIILSSFLHCTNTVIFMIGHLENLPTTSTHQYSYSTMNDGPWICCWKPWYHEKNVKQNHEKSYTVV